MNRPLTILGAERRLFFVALITGGAIFSLMHSLLGGLGLFVVGVIVARIATRHDVEILRILLNSTKFRRRYDPMKQEPPSSPSGANVFRTNKITKDWKEAGSFAAQINLFGFWDEHSFLPSQVTLDVLCALGVSTTKASTTPDATTRSSVLKPLSGLSTIKHGFIRSSSNAIIR